VIHAAHGLFSASDERCDRFQDARIVHRGRCATLPKSDGTIVNERNHLGLGAAEIDANVHCRHLSFSAAYISA
jgi:hypothetical protein